MALRLGIFARVFNRPTLDGVLAAIRSYGLTCTQFNLTCAGLESLPEMLDGQMCRQIRTAFDKHELEMAAISGTFNSVHPHYERRIRDIRRCKQLIRCAPLMGTRLVTLCTGTCDPDNMWRAHPDNAKPHAWNTLLQTIEELLTVAQLNGVTLAIEPESGNVISSAITARRLLDEIRSPYLKVLFDAANLLPCGQHTLMQQQVLEEALSLLGPDIVLAHIKDGPVLGEGKLDFDCYFSLLREHGFSGALVMQDVQEEAIESSLHFVRERLLATGCTV